MTTIQDVAKHAGVGAATVSRVLSGNGYVKQTTRERVLRSIEELNYTPNEMARNLFHGKSGIVAVIIPELAHPFFSEMVSAIEVELCNLGYQTMVCNTFYEKNYELRYLEMLKRQRVDGIIFGAHTSLAAEMYQELQRPVIGLDRRLADTIPLVAADHVAGGRMAAEELIRSGCRNFAQFGDVDDNVSTPSRHRHYVFRRVVEENGLTCHSYPKQPNYSAYNTYQEAAARLFAEHPDVDGIFGTDLYAAACLQYALSHGIRVPQDVKIVAYDGTHMTRFLDPDMTTICQPIQELADESVRLITELIKGNTIHEKEIILPVRLRRGNTTTGNAAAESTETDRTAALLQQ